MQQRFSLLAAPLIALGLALPVDAQHVYAVTNARIVTVAGATLESGSVVMRDGRIEAVGPNVAIPDDATQVDGRGLTVYPGLIDMGRAGSVAPPDHPEPENPETREVVERWKRRTLLRPHLEAAAHLDPGAGELADLASAGITSVLATPDGGGIRGRSSLVHVTASPVAAQAGRLADSVEGRMVLRTPIALHVAFLSRTPGRAYPQALIGLIAFVRQAFLDARHYGQAWTRYEASPHTIDRPTYDEALAAMQTAVDGTLRVVFDADTAPQIRRALNMARELDLQPIIAGGLEADQVALELREGNVPVILSLDFPDRSRVLAPDADEPLRVLRQRADAPRVAAALSNAGVRFAFASSGLEGGKAFVTNAARTVSDGLSADRAIAALTADAAVIAGVGDRLGTIEVGTIADLIVTEGELFESYRVSRRPNSLNQATSACS